MEKNIFYLQFIFVANMYFDICAYGIYILESRIQYNYRISIKYYINYDVGYGSENKKTI